jgi:hypothetical protein
MHQEHVHTERPKKLSAPYLALEPCQSGTQGGKRKLQTSAFDSTPMLKCHSYGKQASCAVLCSARQEPSRRQRADGTTGGRQESQFQRRGHGQREGIPMIPPLETVPLLRFAMHDGKPATTGLTLQRLQACNAIVQKGLQLLGTPSQAIAGIECTVRGGGNVFGVPSHVPKVQNVCRVLPCNVLQGRLVEQLLHVLSIAVVD